MGLDVGVLRAGDRGTGHPPVSALEVGGQVRALPRPQGEPPVAGPGEHRPVVGLPESDLTLGYLQDHGVEPPPYDDSETAR